MRYKKDDWRENANRGLYDRGSVKDIRKYDPISLFIHEKCREHFLTSVVCYGVTNINWEEVFEHVQRKGLHYFPGDPSDLYKAVTDGKINQCTVLNMWGGYHYKVSLDREYFFACIKPMEMRFTLSTIYE